MEEVENVEQTQNDEGDLYALVDFFPLPTVIFRLPDDPFSDASHVTHYVNKRFIEVLGYQVTDIPSHQVLFQRAFPERSYRQKVMQNWTHNIEKPLDKAGGYLSEPVKIRCKNNQELWFKIYTELKRKIFPGFYLVSFCDNTCEHENTELHKNYVSIDTLTQLQNHQSMMKSLADEVARVNRFGDSFSIIIVHLDNLARIKEEFAQEGNDYVLKNVAAMLQGKVRKIDIVARWEDDKFLILIPKTNADQAYKMNELILDRLKEFPFRRGTRDISVSATMGIAEFHINEDVNNTIARADSALYLGKASGQGYIIHPYRQNNYSIKPRFSGKP